MLRRTPDSVPRINQKAYSQPCPPQIEGPASDMKHIRCMHWPGAILVQSESLLHFVWQYNSSGEGMQTSPAAQSDCPVQRGGHGVLVEHADTSANRTTASVPLMLSPSTGRDGLTVHPERVPLKSSEGASASR
jgi:hypothetical protein